MVDHNATVSLSASSALWSTYFNDVQDFPNNKFCYESDGSICTSYKNGAFYTNSLSYYRNMNSYDTSCGESVGIYTSSSDNHIIQFPEPRTITHVFVMAITGDTAAAYYSKDTTTGLDGTWTQFSVPNRSSPLFPNARTQISALAAPITDVVAVKFYASYGGLSGGSVTWNFHVFGDRQSPRDRLAFWHPTRDEEVPGGWFDWKGVDINKEYTQQFRVKNISEYRTASDITVFMDDTLENWKMPIDSMLQAYDPISYADLHTMSIGGSDYAPQITLSSLDNGETSGVITLKYTPMLFNTYDRWQTKIKASAASWTNLHEASALLTAEASLSNTDHLVMYAEVADMTSTVYVTTGNLYRDSKVYRTGQSYRPSNITMNIVSVASASASATGDVYTGVYPDEYGTTGLVADAVIAQRATISLPATLGGDVYTNVFEDTYGHEGMFAEARIAEKGSSSLAAVLGGDSYTDTYLQAYGHGGLIAEATVT